MSVDRGGAPSDVAVVGFAYSIDVHTLTVVRSDARRASASRRKSARRRALAAVALLSLALVGAAPAFAETGPSGALHLGSYYAGTINVPTYASKGLAGCLWGKGFSALDGKAGVQLSFGTVELSVAGGRKALRNFQVVFGLGKLGATETVQHAVNDSGSLATASILYQMGGSQVDAAVGLSGTVTTNPSGTTGSVHAALAPEANFSIVAGKQIALSGSWRGCTNVGPAGTV